MGCAYVRSVTAGEERSPAEDLLGLAFKMRA